MVNFLGPGAFGCARPAAARPTFSADNAPGDVDDWAKDCSDPLSRDGTEWRAAWLNFLIANFRELVAASGVPADNRDDAIIARAIQAGGMNYADASGTANNWTVNPSLAVKAYAAGRVLWVRAPATNTSATVTVAVGALGDRALRKNDGSAPLPGDLVAGGLYPLVDDGTALRVVTLLPSQAKAASFRTTRVIFDTPGSISWPVPDGVTRIRTRAWGPGGGGGFGNNPSGPAGGGAGAYFEWSVDVTPGTLVTGTVGAGGAAGFSGNNGAAGAASSVTVNGQTRTAGGGNGGTNAGGGAVTNSAAGGQVTGVVDYGRNGAPSAGGQQGYSGSGTLYYAGKGGDAPNGGYGGNAGTGAGNVGAAPGGGGGGGASGNAAGAGGRGEIWIEY